MMMLSTSPERLLPTLVRVYWRTGAVSAGIVDVELPLETSDAELIAELCAIRYLMFESQVFNRKPSNGRGYRFMVSTGAIRKLVFGKSQKKYLRPYARFFNDALDQAEIIVKRDIGRVDPNDENTEIEHIFADPKEFTSPIEIVIESPSMGAVHITKHALERFVEFGNTGDDPIKRPIASLQKRLHSSEIMQIAMPRHVTEHKLRKYGSHDQSECWVRPGSTLHYQVVNRNGVRTLVTIFRRNQFF